MPDREPAEDTLGSLVHRDWTPQAIVSSVAFMPLFPVTRGSVIVPANSTARCSAGGRALTRPSTDVKQR